MVDLDKVFSGFENVNLEVKAAQGGIPSSIFETYSSFANTFGGTIILGIGEDIKTKKFVPIGIKEPQKMISDIWNILNNHQTVSSNILLDEQVYPLEYNNLSFVVIEVPRANRHDKPIFVGSDMFKGSFKRNYEGDYRCSKEEVLEMLRDKSDTSCDSLVLDKVNVDVLNADSIKNYRLRFKNIREEHVWNKLSTEQFLIKIGACRVSEVDGKIHPTLGGLIFFGDFVEIMNELPNFFLDYRERQSFDTRWSDRVCSGDGDWSGNVFDFYFRIIDRLTADVKRPFKLDNNLMRIDDTPVHKALRECLANALIHADYYGRRGVVIDKEFRKISFSNPGTFRVDINEAIAGGISDARNARIFNMFSLINVGERSGIGLCDVYSTWKTNGYRRPIIEEKVDPDRVILTLYIEDGANVVSDGANVAKDYMLGLSNDSIYSYIVSHTSASTKEIAKAVGLSVRSVQRNIKELENKNIIKRAGTRNNVEWVILKKA